MQRAFWTRQILWAVVTAALSLMAVPALAGETEEPAPCRVSEVGRALDFWIGEWEVTDGEGMLYGLNRIEWDAGGCAIHEYWESYEGKRGTSLFYFDIIEDTWHQVWVTENTALPWGLKHKEMIARFEDGSVQFQGELMSQEGEPYLDRTTLTPMDDGTVRQLIEISTDGGETWRSMFDAVYERAGD